MSTNSSWSKIINNGEVTVTQGRQTARGLRKGALRNQTGCGQNANFFINPYYKPLLITSLSINADSSSLPFSLSVIAKLPIAVIVLSLGRDDILVITSQLLQGKSI